VITGASSGIGRRIALAYAERGCNVVIADVDEKPRDGDISAATEIRDRFGVDATFVHCDVTKSADIDAAMSAAHDFGGVDIMVNNAGIFASQPFVEVTAADYRKLMSINVDGVFFGAQAAAKRMLDHGRGGSIINLSSVAGLQGSAPFSTYCTSKGAVRLLTMALAAELGPHGIRVNALHPGIIATSMTTGDVPVAAGAIGESIDAVHGFHDVESTPAERSTPTPIVQPALPTSPDEGDDADPGAVAALEQAYKALDDAGRAWIAAIIIDAKRAGLDFIVKGHPTSRRWHLLAALVKLCHVFAGDESFNEDDTTRGCLAPIIGGELADSMKFSLGHLVGCCSAADASRFRDIAVALDEGSASLRFTPTGRSRFEVAA